jgi:transposase
MLYSGIDLHKRSLDICTLDNNGTTIALRKMKTDKEKIQSYFSQWNEPHKAVIECTSGWYWLSEFLTSLNVTVVLAHAKYLKAISYAKVKTDAIDAHTLAKLLRLDYVPEAYQLPPQYRALRDILRQRMKMEQKRHSTARRIASILANFNILVDQSEVHRPEFEQFITSLHLSEEYRMAITFYHRQCLQLLEHKKQLESHFRTQLKPTKSFKLVSSIPGIGDITGSMIIMETGPIERFANDKHYSSYCRLVPGAKDSGARRRHKSGSKDGNPYLKFAFTEAALRAVQHYPEIRLFYYNLQQRTNKRVAQTVVAKELSKITYYVLTREQPFRSFKSLKCVTKNTLGSVPVNPCA